MEPLDGSFSLPLLMGIRRSLPGYLGLYHEYRGYLVSAGLTNIGMGSGNLNRHDFAVCVVRRVKGVVETTAARAMV